MDFYSQGGCLRKDKEGAWETENPATWGKRLGASGKRGLTGKAGQRMLREEPSHFQGCVPEPGMKSAK